MLRNLQRPTVYVLFKHILSCGIVCTFEVYLPIILTLSQGRVLLASPTLVFSLRPIWGWSYSPTPNVFVTEMPLLRCHCCDGFGRGLYEPERQVRNVITWCCQWELSTFVKFIGLQLLEHLMWKMESDEMNWSGFCANLWTVRWTGSWLNATCPGSVAVRREMWWQICYNSGSSMVHPWSMHHTEKVKRLVPRYSMIPRRKTGNAPFKLQHLILFILAHPPRADQFLWN